MAYMPSNLDVDASSKVLHHQHHTFLIHCTPTVLVQHIVDRQGTYVYNGLYFPDKKEG